MPSDLQSNNSALYETKQAYLATGLNKPLDRDRSKIALH